MTDREQTRRDERPEAQLLVAADALADAYGRMVAKDDKYYRYFELRKALAGNAAALAALTRLESAFEDRLDACAAAGRHVCGPQEKDATL